MEASAELAAVELAEQHIIAQNFDFFAVFLDCRTGLLWLPVLGLTGVAFELDISKLLSAQ